MSAVLLEKDREGRTDRCILMQIRQSDNMEAETGLDCRTCLSLLMCNGVL